MKPQTLSATAEFEIGTFDEVTLNLIKSWISLNLGITSIISTEDIYSPFLILMSLINNIIYMTFQEELNTLTFYI